MGWLRDNYGRGLHGQATLGPGAYLTGGQLGPAGAVRGQLPASLDQQRAPGRRRGAGPRPGGADLLAHLGDPTFWFESFQNWQSEFLSTAVLIVLGVVLREKGSSESKAVGDPHAKTGAG
jgi:hypothetical protein